MLHFVSSFFTVISFCFGFQQSSFHVLNLQTKFLVLIWVNNFWFDEFVCMRRWTKLLLDITEVLEIEGNSLCL